MLLVKGRGGLTRRQTAEVHDASVNLNVTRGMYTEVSTYFGGICKDKDRFLHFIVHTPEI